jgi:hypothetical protein
MPCAAPVTKTLNPFKPRIAPFPFAPHRQLAAARSFHETPTI